MHSPNKSGNADFVSNQLRSNIQLPQYLSLYQISFIIALAHRDNTSQFQKLLLAYHILIPAKYMIQVYHNQEGTSTIVPTAILEDALHDKLSAIQFIPDLIPTLAAAFTNKSETVTFANFSRSNMLGDVDEFLQRVSKFTVIISQIDYQPYCFIIVIDLRYSVEYCQHLLKSLRW